MKKAKKPSLWLTSAVIGLGLFIGTYLLMSIGFWFYSNFTQYSNKLSQMDKYLVTNQQVFKKTIFTDLFHDAEKCLNVDKKIQTQCEKEISHSMAIAIIEEQIMTSEYDWPNDLSLAIRKNDKYLHLNWQGKVEDISESAKKSLLNVPVPQFLKFMTRNCNYFGTAGYPTGSCEIYSTINVDFETNGYVIRHIGLNEETNLLIAMVLPLFGVLGFIGAISYGFTSPFPYQILIITLSFFIIPLIVAIFGANFYRNKKLKKK